MGESDVIMTDQWEKKPIFEMYMLQTQMYSILLHDNQANMYTPHYTV